MMRKMPRSKRNKGWEKMRNNAKCGWCERKGKIIGYVYGSAYEATSAFCDRCKDTAENQIKEYGTIYHVAKRKTTI